LLYKYLKINISSYSIHSHVLRREDSVELPIELPAEHKLFLKVKVFLKQSIFNPWKKVLLGQMLQVAVFFQEQEVGYD